jgi:steroid 5-alpha reductase family enzyme
VALNAPSVIAVLGYALLAVIVYFTLAWLLSLARRDASVVDIFWGPGFLILGVLYAALGAGFVGRKALLLTLVAIWSIRLAVHIFQRNRGRGEDKRYRKWREEGGPSYWWKSWFNTFMVQAALMWLISTPLMAAQRPPLPDRITLLDILGALVWLVGFAFEAVSDWQLARFKADPANKGQVMRRGLWAYTRHPNYFGEAMLWWGYFIIALGTPGGFWTLYSPILMTFLLLRVSGVTLLEKGLAAEKPGYADYVQSTSAFIPWFPRRPE